MLRFDFHVGATDQLESEVWRFAIRTQVIVVFLLLAFIGAGFILAVSPTAFDKLRETVVHEIGPLASPTSRPTLGLMTVTPGPSTPTPSRTPIPTETSTATFTPEPCIRQVSANDTLYGLAASCGHTSFDVLSLIVEINNLADANSIIQGQTLIIPWPTVAVTETNTPQVEGSQQFSGTSVAQSDSGGNTSAFDESFDPLFVPTATLPPGIQFHSVSLGETMISIAQLYNANAEIISQLNPEITFNGCDFGERYGGPRCNVALAEGQKVRVPAPTPTPTLSPTPSGSETQTPVPTATFNAPSLQSPSNRSLFRKSELVTLRWNPTGTLGPNEVYRVHVEDMTDGKIFIADTRSMSFILPIEWQGTDNQRHEYRWNIRIIDANNPGNPIFVTETFTFIWDGRGENS
jgi:LysM repeat protein